VLLVFCRAGVTSYLRCRRVDVAEDNVSGILFTGAVDGNGLPVVLFYIWPQRKTRRYGLSHSGRYS
jgi:hypothetical protein